MTKNAAILSWFVLLTLIGTFFNGCAKPAEQQNGAVEIKVAFWGTPEDIDIITHSIEPWQKEHPAIKVRFEHAPYAGYDSKILTRIAGGAAPDVIATEVDYFVAFAEKNVFEGLSPYIKADTNFSLKDFFPEIIERFTVNGEIFVIPRDVAPYACVFYNKDIFDKAGVAYPDDEWTWDEMLEMAKQLTFRDSSGRVTQYGFYGWAWQNFIYGNGGSLVDHINNPTRTTIDEPLSVEGLQFYTDLINKYNVMPTPVALANSGMGIDTMFSSGRLAMFLSGIWEAPLLRNYAFHWDVVMFPKNSKGLRRFGSGGSGYGILKSSKHKQEAWEVVKALTGPAGQIQLAERGLAQPALQSVAKSKHWATHPGLPKNKSMLNEAVRYIVFDPFHPKWREIDAKILVPEFDLLFNGKETATEAAKKMAPKINELLHTKD